jgi:hypothetical protein
MPLPDFPQSPQQPRPGRRTTGIRRRSIGKRRGGWWLLVAAGLACCAIAVFRRGAGMAERIAYARTVSAAGGRTIADIQVGGASVQVNVDGGRTDLSDSKIVDWVERAVRAVGVYYGRFPVAYARVEIRRVPDVSGVFHGMTFPGDTGIPYTRISVGQHTREGQLLDDWMMTHEFTHIGFPAMADQHHWIEEGLATYVEPVARAQAGQIPVSRVWKELVEGLPQGQPQKGDGGLDHTRTWGRTYWGGALYCLMADVEIRRRTGNHKGLQDALRAIVAAGGTIEQEWSIERALQTGDAATDTTAMMDLYNRMKDAPAPIDLAELWRLLGVEYRNKDVSFRDDAPLAAARRAITAAPEAQFVPAN